MVKESHDPSFPEIRKRRLSALLLLVALILGIALRVGYMPRFGSNFDLVSWAMVAEIVEGGGNVYAETTRYNYGPPWAFVVNALARIALLFDNSGHVFMLLLAVFLTLADLGIMGLLARRFGTIPALIFILHPVSIVVSGYMRQFGNVAIFMGFLAVELLVHEEEGSTMRWWAGLLLLGLSITTKHILFAFPLWLAVKERGLGRKLLTLFVPVSIFLASFIPYWAEGRAGIMTNVFGYSPGTLQPLWGALVPPLLTELIPSRWVFFAALGLFALVFRRRPMHESLLLYLLILYIFSPEMANQYLAVPLAAVAVFINPPFFLYSIAASLHLLKQLPGSSFPDFFSWIPAPVVDYPVCSSLAFFGLIWIFYSTQIKAWMREACQWLLREVRGQLAGRA